MGTSRPHTLWTIGHSIRAWDAFVAMLQEAGIAAVADIRRFAGSRRHPQLSAEAMAQALPDLGIQYVPMPALGGRRRPLPDSPNVAWRSDSFRGYADYMQTVGYRDACDRLAALAADTPTAIMCAEAVWWRCHRALIADDLKSRGWEVIHLLGLGHGAEHPYTRAARIVDGRLDYSAPAPQAELF